MFGNASDSPPMIHIKAPVWIRSAIQSDSNMYCRVTQDRAVLARVQAIISGENPELDYIPLLAVVITFNNVPVSFCTACLYK